MLFGFYLLTSTVLLKKKKTVAKTKLLSAETSTNQAQTIEPIWGEFGVCGGTGDVIAYNLISNILKTEAAQTKLLVAQTSTNEVQTNETIWGEFGECRKFVS